MRRNANKSGDYLMVDSLSGFTHYRSQMAQDWDGSWRLATDLDGKHPDLVRKPIIKEALPQETVPATPLQDISPVTDFRPLHVGTTNVLTPVSPADHLFEVSAA